MLRVAENLRRRSKFDDLPQIHHGDPVRHIVHHCHVVADEQIGDPKLALQILQQFQHARLDRHIKGGNAFVRDDEVRLKRQRARDADALALAARKLVRVAVKMCRLQPGVVAELMTEE